MKRIVLFLLMGVCCSFAMAQYSLVESRELDIMMDHPIRYAATGWRWNVDVTTFLRDAEFSLPYTRGYTATGFFLQPTVGRRIGSQAAVTLGLHLAGVAGYDGIHSWQPLVRLELRPVEHLSLVMGSIYGALGHGLYEPMLDRERYIYDHQEEGVQLRWKLGQGRVNWMNDTWLHWEELLEPWHANQERFTMGSSNILNFCSADDDSALKLSLPFSFLGSHRGGQFTSLDTCIQSLFNESVGLRLEWMMMQSRWTVDVPWFFYQDISPRKWMAFDNGWGFWPQLSYRRGLHFSDTTQGGQLLASVGFWRGHQYIAPRGSYLFQSISWHKPSFSAPEREMITAKVGFERAYVENIQLGLDGEFYYDMVEKSLDLVFGLYLRYRF